MWDVTRDLQTPTFMQTATFPLLLPPWSARYFMHGNIYNAPFNDSKALGPRSRPNYSAHAACYSSIQELCLCWSLRLDTPCTWNYYPCHQSSRRDDFRQDSLANPSTDAIREHC